MPTYYTTCGIIVYCIICIHTTQHIVSKYLHYMLIHYTAYSIIVYSIICIHTTWHILCIHISFVGTLYGGSAVRVGTHSRLLAAGAFDALTLSRD